LEQPGNERGGWSIWNDGGAGAMITGCEKESRYLVKNDLLEDFFG